MDTGIVTNWSVGPPHPPYVTIGISLLCVFSLLVYSGLSPLLQQAMIDVLGMRPAPIDQLLEKNLRSWWDVPALSVVTALFVHASWLHLLGNLAFAYHARGRMRGATSPFARQPDKGFLDRNRN